MRKTRVENKYNLTPNSVMRLKVNREKVNESFFWRNNLINAWCISGNTAKEADEHKFGTYNSFLLYIFDKDSQAFPDQIILSFYEYGELSFYMFDKFYDFSTIKQESDLEIQEMFLEKINHLIDEGVLIIP